MVSFSFSFWVDDSSEEGVRFGSSFSLMSFSISQGIVLEVASISEFSFTGDRSLLFISFCNFNSEEGITVFWTLENDVT